MQLYSYYRSSAAYRVRIALNLKGLDYISKPINLVNNEQQADIYRHINPQGLVPTLITDNNQVLTQSMAICEYLDERYPQNPLLPKDTLGRARVRALANLVASDIHPLNNLRVLTYLSDKLKVTEDERTQWYQDWVSTGFQALESLLHTDNETGQFCHGNTPTLADISLIPQLYNAQRFSCSLQEYPIIRKVAAACGRLTTFAKAHPDRQPDSK